ncbi:MAG: phosphopantetheine-binding protein [Beijerinckiaceae bacterium]|nr:phosphopantetheine-binding protein [Beijerinckiaceae bacterium]
MQENVAEAAKKIIAEHLDRQPASLTLETQLDELGVNSLQLTEIIMDLEDMFEIEFRENTSEAWASLKSVGDVVEAVQAMIVRKP